MQHIGFHFVHTILCILAVGTSSNIKAFRMGNPSQKASPNKILLNYQKIAKDCLKRKNKLNGSNVKN